MEFTIANNQDVVAVEVGALALDQVRRGTLKGVIDTGATRLVLPKSAVKTLGLPLTGQATVRYADHRTATHDMVKNVSVELLGRQGVFTAVVKPGRVDALIGAIVMEDLDYLVDCNGQTIHPRDPNTIVSEVE